MNRRVAALCIGICGCLTACGQAPNGDLVQYVAQVKARQASLPVTPVETKKRETFRYRADSDGIRDPFLGGVAVARTSGGNGGPRPDNRRGRQALEQYPLDSLSLVGTLSGSNRIVALVRSPDGAVHQVKLGDYMGQNYGKVVAIDDQQIRLRELVPDGSGGWQKRPATISLVK